MQLEETSSAGFGKKSTIQAMKKSPKRTSEKITHKKSMTVPLPKKNQKINLKLEQEERKQRLV